MDIYAPIARNVVHPLWLWKNGSRRGEYLRRFRKTQFLAPEQIEEQRWSSLKSLLGHAYENCAYYRRRFDAAGIRPEDISSRQDLLSIPALKREDVQQNAEEMLSASDRENRLIMDQTGGSTGAPISFRYARDRLDSRQACTARHDEWAGYRPGDKKALLWGAVRDLDHLRQWKERSLNLVMNRTLILDASAVTEETMAGFADSLNRFRPKVVLAYANVATLFAGFLLDGNIRIPRPHSVITSAELLSEDGRRLIEEAFGCRVYNRYGCREFAVLASECGAGEGMHIAAESFYLEFVADGKHAADGERGKIVVTDLLSYAMPFIRYEIGDVGSPLDGPCACGRGLPRMKMEGGRVTEFIRSTRGELVSGVALATYAITRIDGVRQVQIVQESLGDVAVKLVKGPGFSASSEGELIQRFKDFLGDDMNVEIVPVTEIPASPSGKHRFSISTVAGDYL